MAGHTQNAHHQSVMEAPPGLTMAHQTSGFSNAANTPANQTHISFPIANQDFASTMNSNNNRESVEFGGKRIGGKGGSRIKVAVRIRPLLDSELNHGHNSTNLAVKEASHQIQ